MINKKPEYSLYPFKPRMAAMLLGMVLPICAQAWTAIATSDGRYFHHNLPEGTPEAAKAKALEQCRRLAQGACHIIGTPQAEKLMVVFAGEASFGFGAGTDGDKAALAARRDCERVSRSCEPIEAIWAPGVRYAALAFGSEVGYYVSVNQLTQEASNKAVLALCKKHRSTQECKLSNMDKMHVFGHYAVASSATAQRHFVKRRQVDKDKAAEEVLATCRKETGTECVLEINVFNEQISHPNEKQIAWLDSIRPLVSAAFERRRPRAQPAQVRRPAEVDPDLERRARGDCGWQMNPNDPINPHMVPKAC